ncbi:MAG: iron ABC transporter permease, partial [Massilibacteroides sp.]|nr:iron ABC transporter permease [Massilibacteroides sp.]
MKKKAILLCLLLVVLVVINLTDGTVNIPIHETLLILKGEYTSHTAWEHIIWQNRLPQTVTAMLAGSALAVSGLLMQTLFRNPLAGPSILGISDGANLGVAIIMLYFGGNLGLLGAAGGFLTVLMAAMVGAFSILMLIIYFSTKVKNNVMLLIIGIMIGYLTSSIISILNFHASTDKVHAFVMWGMG